MTSTAMKLNRLTYLTIALDMRLKNKSRFPCIIDLMEIRC